MNNERRRIKDINILSAYQDNALKAKEVEKLEARLKREPGLREVLEDLRRTKLVISRLERVRAPRNYTLTPDMVKIRTQKRNPLFTTLRLASSFAAILLVALFGVQYLLQGGFQQATLQSEAPMMEAARTEGEVSPEPLIFWSEPGIGGAAVEGYGGGSGGESIAEEPMLEVEEAAPEEVEEEAASPEEESDAPTASELIPRESDAADSEAQEKRLEDSSPILGVNPEQSGEILEHSEPILREREFSLPWHSVIMWAQISLAIIAVGGGIMLLILRSKR